MGPIIWTLKQRGWISKVADRKVFITFVAAMEKREDSAMKKREDSAMEKRDNIAMETKENKAYGEAAEKAAEQWLAARGYVIRERNWSPRRGHVELDLVAQLGTTIAFVEVKARTSDFLDPVEAVNRNKINRVVRAANSYLLTLPPHEADALESRFDIIAISGQSGSWEIEHIPDAFFPPLTTR